MCGINFVYILSPHLGADPHLPLPGLWDRTAGFIVFNGIRLLEGRLPEGRLFCQVDFWVSIRVGSHGCYSEAVIAMVLTRISPILLLS